MRMLCPVELMQRTTGRYFERVISVPGGLGRWHAALTRWRVSMCFGVGSNQPPLLGSDVQCQQRATTLSYW